MHFRKADRSSQMTAPYLITDPKLERALSPCGRTIREISRDYFRREYSWFYLIEAMIFGLLAAVSLWPIVFAAEAIRALPG